MRYKLYLTLVKTYFTELSSQTDKPRLASFKPRLKVFLLLSLKSVNVQGLHATVVEVLSKNFTCYEPQIHFLKELISPQESIHCIHKKVQKNPVRCRFVWPL